MRRPWTLAFLGPAALPSLQGGDAFAFGPPQAPHTSTATRWCRPRGSPQRPIESHNARRSKNQALNSQSKPAVVGAVLRGAWEDAQEEYEVVELSTEQRDKMRKWEKADLSEAEKVKAMLQEEERQQKHQEYMKLVKQNRKDAAKRQARNMKKFFRRKAMVDVARASEKKRGLAYAQSVQWERNYTQSVEDLQVGQWLSGRVRNVRPHGAWVDVGCGTDGLLHVRDMSEGFTPSVQDRVKTGDNVNVTVKFVDLDSDTPRFGLSLVPVAVPEVLQEAQRALSRAMGSDRPWWLFTEGEEVWGYVTKVTNFGFYVEVGADIEAFLNLVHYDRRDKTRGARQHPSELLAVGQRIRAYVLDVDGEADNGRIKLTTERPDFLPRVGDFGLEYTYTDLVEERRQEREAEYDVMGRPSFEDEYRDAYEEEICRSGRGRWGGGGGGGEEGEEGEEEGEEGEGEEGEDWQALMAASGMGGRERRGGGDDDFTLLGSQAQAAGAAAGGEEDNKDLDRFLASIMDEEDEDDYLFDEEDEDDDDDDDDDDEGDDDSEEEGEVEYEVLEAPAR